MSDIKAVVVLCTDRTLQQLVRDVVSRAGCRAIFLESVTGAMRRLGQEPAVLILVDPALVDGTTGGCSAAALAAHAPVVELPVRTSSTGVRRIARGSHGSARWLREVIVRHCRR